MATEKQLSRILLVDDSEQNRYVISRTLKSLNLSIEECATGTAALERVKSLPDLVILDIRLPDLPGYEVCRRIKQDPATLISRYSRFQPTLVSKVKRQPGPPALTPC